MNPTAEQRHAAALARLAQTRRALAQADVGDDEANVRLPSHAKPQDQDQDQESFALPNWAKGLLSEFLPGDWVAHQAMAVEAIGNAAASRARSVIRQHPWSCVAAGLAVGALLTHQRKRLVGTGMALALPWLSNAASGQALPLFQQLMGLVSQPGHQAQRPMP